MLIRVKFVDRKIWTYEDVFVKFQPFCVHPFMHLPHDRWKWQIPRCYERANGHDFDSKCMWQLGNHFQLHKLPMFVEMVHGFAMINQNVKAFYNNNTWLANLQPWYNHTRTNITQKPCKSVINIWNNVWILKQWKLIHDMARQGIKTTIKPMKILKM
jgi:hypothetical protein